MNIIRIKFFHSVKIDKEETYIDVKIKPDYTITRLDDGDVRVLYKKSNISTTVNWNNVIYCQTEEDSNVLR